MSLAEALKSGRCLTLTRRNALLMNAMRTQALAQKELEEEEVEASSA